MLDPQAAVSPEIRFAHVAERVGSAGAARAEDHGDYEHEDAQEDGDDVRSVTADDHRHSAILPTRGEVRTVWRRAMVGNTMARVESTADWPPPTARAGWTFTGRYYKFPAFAITDVSTIATARRAARLRDR